MFFYGSEPLTKEEGDFNKNLSIGIGAGTGPGKNRLISTIYPIKYGFPKIFYKVL